VAEWLRSGLQSRLHRFDSGRRLQSLGPAQTILMVGALPVDRGPMTRSSLATIAIALMSMGLVLLVVSGMDDGWTLLTGIGVGLLVVAIGAEVVALRRAGHAS
jgi:hypothetical protein